jgi:hypothetical protein
MTSILGPDKQAHIAKLAASLPAGAFAECGVYRGGILKMLATAHPGRTVYGFDTFAGLPAEMWGTDELHSVGDFDDTSLRFVRAATADSPNIRLVQGVFPDSAVYVKDRFALVHLDFDFYESTRAALEWFLPRMVAGGVIVFDDYEWEYCPGVKRAIDEVGLAVDVSVKYQAVYRVQ